MTQLICDKCRKAIWNGMIYYTVRLHSNNNDMFTDEEADICSKCASLYSIDGKLIVGKELIFEESEDKE